jgi:RecJ-like exonuclease
VETVKDIEHRVNIESNNQEKNLGDTFNDVKKHIDANRERRGDHENNSPANPIQNK